MKTTAGFPRPRLWGSYDVFDADLARVRADLAALDPDERRDERPQRTLTERTHPQRDERSREEPGRARRRSLRSRLRAPAVL